MATPVDAAVAWLQTIETDAVVTSTCSVMRPLRAAARGAFVAGHPWRGHRRAVCGGAAPTVRGEAAVVDAKDVLVDALVHDCGAVLERVDAEEHDAAVALTSHLPQVLSTALAAHLHGRDDLLRFAGSGLHTFLRLAGSDAEVWAPVLAGESGSARAARGGDRRAGGVRSSRRIRATPSRKREQCGER